MARFAALLGLVIVLGGCAPLCGIGGKFSLSNAHVDAQYDCPYPSDHLPYAVHATIDASNTLGSTVTIKSLKEDDVLETTSGNWNGPAGVKDGGPVTDYQPKSVPSGGNATVKFTIGFECTNNGGSTRAYGDFSFKFTFDTSAGTFTINAGNRHRLNFPPTT